MKLYIHPGSPNSRRARIAARLAGAQVEEVIVDVPAGDNRTREYLALNPMGKVPTLATKGESDGERVVLESYAIGVELALGTPLFPKGEEAQVLRWQFFDACHFAPPLGTLTFQNLFAPEPDAEAVARAIEDWKRYAAVVETALEGKTWLVGDQGPTLADVALFASLTYADVTGVPLADFPNLARWRAALEDRPEVAATKPPLPG